MKVAIPSYDRPKVLKEKTLAYLLKEGFDPTEIHIFLKNEQQLTLYKQQIDLPVVWVVCQNRNLSEKRQFITDYFPKGELVFSIDDDIKRVKMLVPVPLKVFVERMFEEMVKAEANVWGIYPVSNLFFCRDRMRLGKQFVIACCYGFRNLQDFRYADNSGGKEDIWFSAFRSEKDGKVLRYDGACPDTSYYTKGGLTEARTPEVEEESCRKVIQDFPALLEYKKKANGHPYVVFKRQNLICLPGFQPNPPLE